MKAPQAFLTHPAAAAFILAVHMLCLYAASSFRYVRNWVEDTGSTASSMEQKTKLI